ncbi:MAG: dihydrofolate reductase family protein [Gemmatimonadaceae bacterium]
MRRLHVFNSVTLDGYFSGPDGDLSWAHKSDPEWNEFVAGNAKGESTLLFGRKTYEMMVAFWPTPAAMEQFPDVAKGMNDAPKIVFSRTLKKSPWKNTTVVSGDPAEEVRKLKNQNGAGMTLLGSGTIVAQLTDARLVDQYQVVVNNVVLGKGRTMFEGVKNKLDLKLANTRSFKNGNVVLTYELAK